MTIHFLVQVLRINDRKPFPDELRKELLANARYIRCADVWLFEGDWETCFGEWIDQGVDFDCLGIVILETTRGEEEKLFEEIKHLLPELTS